MTISEFKQGFEKTKTEEEGWRFFLQNKDNLDGYQVYVDNDDLYISFENGRFIAQFEEFGHYALYSLLKSLDVKCSLV